MNLKYDPETMPARIRALPVDEKRGYPVPWFVQWVKDKDGNKYPEFRAMDAMKLVRAVQEKRCWVCGDKLGRYQTFVAGPMCGINRVSAEPPCHHECAVWAVKVCPFLTMPKMIRREDEIINNETFVVNSPGVALPHNPGATMLWTTQKYTYRREGKGILFIFGDAEKVEWYAKGREATRDEVLQAVAKGLPKLEALVQQDPDPQAVHDFERSVRAFYQYLPSPIILASS